MSVSVSYHFQHPSDLHTVAGLVSQLTGTNFVFVDTAELYEVNMWGMWWDIRPDESPTTHFSSRENENHYFILNDTNGGSVFRRIQIPLMLNLIMALHLKEQIAGALLFNFDGPWAIFENRQSVDGETVLFDTLSQASIANYFDLYHLIEPRLGGQYR